MVSGLNRRLGAGFSGLEEQLEKGCHNFEELVVKTSKQ